MTLELQRKFHLIHENLVNGNRKDHRESVKSLNKVELLQYINYMGDVTVRSSFEIVDFIIGELNHA